MRSINFKRSVARCGAALIAAGLCLWQVAGTARSAAQPALTVVSAASFAQIVAPEAVVTAFGARLATQTAEARDADPNTPGIQLPTTLGGSTVEVNQQRAGLFYVSPTQINFLLPAGTPVGTVSVVVRASDGTQTTGTAQVNRVAPAIFTANPTGQGVPVATLVRVKPDGTQIPGELVLQFDALLNRFITRPINFGAGNADRIVLILFLTGLRGAPDPNGDGNANESVQVRVGNLRLTPFYAGRQPDLVGLDQLNVELPSTLIGSGIVNLTVTASGGPDSNSVEIEFAAGASSGSQLQISDSSFTTNEDTAVNLTLPGGNNSSRPLRYVVTSLPRKGRLSGSAPNLTYTPQPNYNGVDNFTYRVNNGIDESDEIQVAISIKPVNDPPTLNLPAALATDVSQELSFEITASDVDIDQPLTLIPEPLMLPTGATLTTIEPRHWRVTWTPITEQGGKIFKLTFRVQDRPQDSDDPPLSDTKSVRITIGLLWGKTSGPEGADITALLIDRNTPALYAGTLTGGVYRSLDSGQSWTPINGDLSVRRIYGLYQRGTRLFAGTVDGVFYSDNGGQNWRAGLRGGPVQALAEVGNTLYAGTIGIGIRVSTDGGQTWTSAVNNSPDAITATKALAVRGNSLFAALADQFGGALYVTTDGARTWQRLETGLPNRGFFEPMGLVDLKTNQTHLFTAIAGEGVYVSTNNGLNWQAANNGLTDRDIKALAVNGTLVLVATSQGLFLSTNNAQSWTRINSSFTSQRVNALAFNGSDLVAGTAGAAVFTSANSGQTWASTSLGFTNSSITAFALDEAAIKLYAATDTGVYVTANNGQSWSVFNPVLPDSAPIAALAVSGANLVASASGGVFISAIQGNQGSSWTPANTGLTNRRVSALAVFNRRVFAATAGGVFVSANDGQSWAQAGSELSGLAVTVLAVSGVRLYAGTSAGVYVTETGQSWTSLGLANYPIGALAANGSFVVAASRAGNFVSNDGGRNWRNVIAGLDNPVITLAIRGTTAYAGLEQDGIYALSPESEVWLPVNDSLTDLTVNALLVNGSNMFAGTSDGVSLSTNSPQTWAALNANLGVLAVDAVSSVGGAIYAGTAGGGVYRLPEQAQSWVSFETGLPTSVRVSALAANSTTLYAGTGGGGGVFRSFDQGRNWTAVNNGLNNRTVNALAADEVRTLTGTEGGGVFRLTGQSTSWETVNTGLANQRILALALGSAGLFAGSEFGQVFFSDNFGQTWTSARRLESADPDARLLGVRMLGLNGASLFAGTFGASLYRSNNRGQSWILVAPGDLGNRLLVTSFVVSGARLYVGTWSGVFVSTDQGETWRQINAGLISTYVNSLAVSGGKIYAGTANGGVFVSRIPD